MPLNSFVPRPYQLPPLRALDEGFKRAVVVLPRRAGKDIMALNYMIRAMYETPGVYYYVFDTLQHGRKVIWDAISSEGIPIRDYFPKNLILSQNSVHCSLRMRCRNGGESQFNLVGSDRYDHLRGTNPRGIVFSEWAFQNPEIWNSVLRQPLAANDGWAMFISTPKGKNHFYDLAKMAEESPFWFYYFLTLEDTQHMNDEQIAQEKLELSEDLFLQEYMCDFNRGIDGAVYGRYMLQANIDSRITSVPVDPYVPVHTAWDLGVADDTVVIFFQLCGQEVHIIDCYSNNQMGLEHYAKVLQHKDYLYGNHYAPHDIKVRELGSGLSRWEKASQLGIKFKVLDLVSLEDGIEVGRSLFSKVWIDQHKCRPLIAALESYHYAFNAKLKAYSSTPVHNHASHFADAYRYLAMAVPRANYKPDAQGLDARYRAVTQQGPNFGFPFTR